MAGASREGAALSGVAVAPLRIAVVGCGAFGRNHLRVYNALTCLGQPVKIAAVVDPNAGARESAALEYGAQAFASVNAMLAASSFGPSGGLQEGQRWSRRQTPSEI